MAFEGMEQFQAALHTYISAWNYINATKTSRSYYSVQFWTEKILYRLCLLSLRLRNSYETLEHFRRYRRTVDQNVSTRERLTVYYWYWRTLSEILRQKIEQGALTTIADEESKYSPLDLWLRVGLLVPAWSSTS